MRESHLGYGALRDMPEEERPRERLVRVGAEALRDAELLAVLFRTGTRDVNAVGLAESLLAVFGDLRALQRASVKEIRKVKGIGRVKAIEIKAALELGKRLTDHRNQAPAKIRCAEDVAGLLMSRFKDLETEHFKALALNTKNEVLKILEVSRGGLDTTSAAPRDVFRDAVREGAAALIVCHNHPSGDPEPSATDIDLTARLREAGDVLGVPLLDHVIFGDGRWVSLKERQLM